MNQKKLRDVAKLKNTKYTKKLEVGGWVHFE